MGAVAPWTSEFARTMTRLVGLKFAPSDLTTHWEALRDLTPAQLDAGVTRAARECDEYPSPKMIRAFAVLQAPRVIGPDEDRSEPIAEPKIVPFPAAGRDLHVTREWRFYCDICHDTGWSEFHCGTNGAVTCGRDECSYTHTYVNRCGCWYSNPALLKRRQRNAQQAHARMGNRND